MKKRVGIIGLLLGFFVLSSCSALNGFLQNNEDEVDILKAYSFQKIEKATGVKIDLNKKSTLIDAPYIDSVRYVQAFGRYEKNITDTLNVRVYSRRVNTQLIICKRKKEGIGKVYYSLYFSREKSDLENGN